MDKPGGGPGQGKHALSRRKFLTVAGSAGVAVAATQFPFAKAKSAPARFTGYPFTLGIEVLNQRVIADLYAFELPLELCLQSRDPCLLQVAQPFRLGRSWRIEWQQFHVRAFGNKVHHG